jgi:hypothetical protein
LAWELATNSDPKLRDTARAVVLAERVVDLSRKQGDDRDTDGRNRLGNYWNTLGVARYRTDKLEGAIDALQTSLKFANGGEPRYACEDWFFLAMASWKLDHKDVARSWYDRAVAWAMKNEPKDEELRRFRAEAAALLGIEEKD